MPASNHVAVSRELFEQVRDGLRPELQPFWARWRNGTPIPPPPLGGKRVLDLGDEPSVRAQLADLGAWVLGEAQLNADITCLPFRDQTFDAVVLHHVVERCSVPGAVQTMQEAARVTRTRLVIGLTTGVRYDGKLLSEMQGAEYRNQYPWGMFTDTLSACGFGRIFCHQFRLSPDALVVADREEAQCSV